MINLPIIFDPSTGLFIGDSSTQNDALNPIQNVVLFQAMTAGSCVAIIEYTAKLITSKYNHNYAGRNIPYIDGVILKDGNVGDTVPMASVRGYSYVVPFSLGYLGDTLYLGQNGLPTVVAPTRAAGDLWYEIIGRRLNENLFLFEPYDPADLTTGIVIPTPPNYYPDTTTDKIVLAQAMPQLTCFAIGANGEAYTVTSNDDTIPLIDGITLESGGIGQQIKIGRLRNQWYTVTQYFDTQQYYWLNSNGGISNTMPSGVKWAMIVGRSSPNSNQFIFDPQLPIQLA